MLNPLLLSKIRDQLASGKLVQDIKTELLKQGEIGEEDIDELLETLSASVIAAEAVPTPEVSNTSTNINPGVITGSAAKARLKRFGLDLLVILVLLGSILILFSISVFNKDRRLTSKITGHVVDYHSSSSCGPHSGCSTTYYDRVTYTVNGQVYTAETINNNPPEVGEDVELFYNPSQPTETTTFHGVWAQVLGIVIGMLGIFMLILGPILFTIFLRRSRRIP